jgi:membrane protein implicated in regulation of membrane protease activity
MFFTNRRTETVDRAKRNPAKPVGAATMKINPQSASALAWAAAAATVLGFMIMSPSGQFISFIIAVVLAIIPTLFGSKRLRVAGGVILAISLALAYQVYPAFKKEGSDYRDRVKARSAKVPAQSPVEQQEKK